MRINIITLFPHFFTTPLQTSILKIAQEKQALQIDITDLRPFGLGERKQVDDTPYGGGAGMLIRPDVASEAIKQVKAQPDADYQTAKVIHFSPRGIPLTQERARAFAAENNLILFNSHYEGVDQRFLDTYVDFEVSIGDYVLSGGEVASLVFIDTITRLLPDVLGNDQSSHEESFEIGEKGNETLLEYPHYTKPPVFEEIPVPEVLISGHHERIKQWRQEKAMEITKKTRPDLLKGKS